MTSKICVCFVGAIVYAVMGVDCISTDCVKDTGPSVVYICTHCADFEDLLPYLANNDIYQLDWGGDTFFEEEYVLGELANHLEKFTIVDCFQHSKLLLDVFNYINEFCIPDFSTTLSEITFHWFKGSGPDGDAPVDSCTSFRRCMTVSICTTCLLQLDHSVQQKFPAMQLAALWLQGLVSI